MASLLTRTSLARRRFRARPSLEVLEDRVLLASGIDTTPAVTFRLDNSWSSGFQAGITIVNDQAAPMDDWRLAFDSTRNIDSIWNARIVEHTGQHYVITHVGWNNSIAPGASISFGYTSGSGSGDAQPTGYVLNWGTPDTTTPTASATYRVTDNWGSGFRGEIQLKNLGTTAINSWKLEFDAANTITSLWNGTMTRQGTHYTVTDAGWNRTIAPGASVTFGFNATAVDPNAVPMNYLLNGVRLGEDSPPPPPPPPPPPVVVPTVSINSASVVEGDLGDTAAAFVVRLSQATTQIVTVNYATRDGTASSTSDYASASGTLTFQPGETQKPVSVAVHGDTSDENDESFAVALTAVTGATLATSQATGTIVDDDTTAVAQFNYGDALQKAIFFYDTQRAGDLPDDFRVEWRGDAAMSDGADVGLDLTGGFWDAGDHVKFVLPMASSMTLLTWGLVQYAQAYEQSGQAGYLRDVIRWGTDWLMKAHPSANVFYAQVGNGDLDHSFWGAPEVMPMARPSYKVDPTKPGSDVAGEAAAALAAAAIVFRSSDPAYADELLRHARELFTFADTYRGKYSDSIPEARFYPSSHYLDELTWGAAWLYKATGERAYLDKAETLYAQNFAGQTMVWTHAWDDKRYGTVVLLAQLTGKDVYKNDAERWLNYWTVGLNGGATRVPYTAGGLAHLNGWGSLRYASTTAFLAFVYSDTVRDYAGRYRDFARSQINYILGANPNGRSYMVGFGNSPPQFPHHRGASGVWDGNVDNPTPNRHILYGALVGGPESANDNNYHDVRGNYISNEVALDYNAGFTGALARMYMDLGGDPLPDFPLPEVRDAEFFVEAKINRESTTYTEVSALLNNRSAWPARASSSLSFLYFVDLSELYAGGRSVADVEVVSNYSQGGRLGALLPWDESRHIWYVEMSFAGVNIVPGAGTFRKEAQLRVGLKSGLPASLWDPTNDWSYQGLPSSSQAAALSRFIPVYEAGSVRLAGELPSATPGQPLLSVADVSVAEGDGAATTATLTVSLSRPSDVPVTVAFTTVNDTAQAGSDYTAVNGTLTFAPGETRKLLAVPILADDTAESSESFRVQMSGASNAALARSLAVVTVTDDDAPPAPAGVVLTVRDDWGTGFVANVTITNTQATAISGWVLEFDFAYDITSIWNAEIVSHVGNHYVIRSASWNGTIAPGASVTFGFQGASGNVTGGLQNVVLLD